MAIIIQLRRGDAAVWTANNPVLAVGEMGVEIDTGKFKVGDGATEWNSLGYSSGDDGSDGAVWYSGEGEPGGEVGQDGDFYLDTTNGDVYAKDDGSWSVDMNIQGADGSVWYADSRDPDSGDAEDSDVWLNTESGDVFHKADGSWSLALNIKGTDGADGVIWHSGGGEPAGELGDTGDYYLNTTNGDVYFNDGSWSAIMNIMGEDGADGEPGAGSASTVETNPGVIGPVTLDFREHSTQIVEQGDGDIAYDLTPMSPLSYVGWDPEVWEFGTDSEYPKLKWEV